MFNVSIAGRLTKDAEYKKAGAYDVAEFTIAVSHGKDKTSGKFSDYIQEPKHVTYIQTWLDAYVND